jgi:CBS domain-containing protein
MDLPALQPRHLMTAQVICTWPDEPLNDAVNKMLSHHVHRLVVTRAEGDQRHPIGILSMTDLARVTDHLS